MTCTKIKFRNKKEAKARLRTAKLKHDTTVKSVYKCRECGKWHMTSQSSALHRAITRVRQQNEN